MKISEKENYPVRYEDILIFPEYFGDFKNKKKFISTISKYKDDKINYYVVGVGNTYEHPYTTVLLLNRFFDIRGVRQKISIFLAENSSPSLNLRAFKLTNERILGIVICKEVLHTAIAEVYRMMGVNRLAVTIGGGDFWGLQRNSWIDQMSLFSDICNAPLVSSCGATKQQGGINLIIERKSDA